MLTSEDRVCGASAVSSSACCYVVNVVQVDTTECHAAQAHVKSAGTAGLAADCSASYWQSVDVHSSVLHKLQCRAEHGWHLDHMAPADVTNLKP